MTTKISSSPTFCPEPWTTLNIAQSGQVLPCFHSYGNSNKQPHSLGNVKQESVQSIISGPVLTSLKQTIAQGQWHPFCRQCQQHEAHGFISARQTKIVDPAVVTQIDSDSAVFKLTHLALNWSNICNLTCTYCNPTTSTAWQQVLNMPITHVRNESSGLVELARASRDSLIGLSLGGGEPLLQTGLLNLLQEIDSDRVDVMVTTNLSMNLERNAIYQELRHWPNVQWMISFDNVTRDKFEYVRRGAKWSQFVYNIQVLKEHNQQITAHPAYSIYCAFDLVEYYEFCQAQDLPIFWCDLVDPAPLDARRLKPELRQQASKEIDRILALYATDVQNEQRLSLDNLKRYQAQLLIPPDTTVDPWAWHAVQEQARSHPTRFKELWSNVTGSVRS